MGFHTYFFYKREETGYYIVAFPPGEKATLYMYFFIVGFPLGKATMGKQLPFPSYSFLLSERIFFP